METIVLASHNRNKAQEIQMLLGNQFHVILQQAFDIPPIEETGSTFEENALLKAKTVYDIIGLPVIGDDSGLEVVALNNQPGVYSSRFAGDNASDDDNIDKLLRKMHNIPTEKRTARFRCVVAFLGTSSDDQPVFFEGEWAGYIAKERRGKNGFGYDPVFVDLQSNLTAAELESDQKNKISHRGKAMQSLKSYLGGS
ncbi:MAG TPA: RdgB/HAM1 family non-canonical purine NTP pyrophosphatase [Gammaproteobacteria bacterium]|nr:RdgB/HAM1 family non-canonical purine NTP pyrophosphatase [Gammaproteobacteria bacterium]HIB24963.1 RdgB/HAM1 family non-canonical purine NTP pyrophosphatase [Gammaproteobacteria bacterium]